ncbi:MAG: metallophosphoesterase [Oscillospiraceae bacterium]|nr:metallophosphoesterase [Oscillospiraceae bacterium]
MNKKFIAMVLILVLTLGIAVLAIDSRLKTVHYEIENPKSEEPLRIALITDLHSCTYGGADQSDLLEALRAQNPDVVLFGGDIFDSHGMPDENAVTALRKIGSEYSCYYVSGNHEVRHGKLDYYKEIVASCGVRVLDGQHTKMAVSMVSGTPDIYGFDDVSNYENLSHQLSHIEETIGNYHFSESFNILIIHRPEEIEHYAKMGFDLVLSGHAHGGQWRIPGVLNGLYTPDQGLFPEYAGGLYEVGNTKMIVSRGLAKESNVVPRIFNRPELVIIDIV